MGHTWDNGVQTTPPTENASGIMTYSCDNCSETKEEIIPALEHIHNYDAVMTDPNCTEQGYTTYTCCLCGESYTADYTEALGHSPVSDENGNKFCEICGIMLSTGGNCGDNLTWEYTADGTLTISGEGEMDDYQMQADRPWNDLQDQITAVIIHNGVTRIGDRAFYHFDNLTSVSIADSVVIIGVMAFCTCPSLPAVIIPEHVTVLGESAFQSCESLSDLTIPGSVTTIGSRAFENCNSLTSMVIPEGVQTIGNSAFSGCDNLTDITIPSSVTTIEGYVFNGSRKLSNVVLSEGLTSIGQCAFSSCDSLTSIVIPASVTNLGDGVFSYCSALTEITVAESNQHFFTDESGILYDINKTRLIKAPVNIAGDYTIADSVTTIDSCAFYECADLTSITIPDSVIAMGQHAFGYCDTLTKVTGLGRIDTIPYAAFQLCYSLESIRIPETVTTISNYAFDNCSKLEQIAIPATVTAVGNYAFADCSLDTVLFEGNAPQLGHGFLRFSTATVHYPAGNETWTADVMQQYEGTLTWAPQRLGGTCGEDLIWILTEDGTLTIFGKGGMYDYNHYGESGNQTPWSGAATEISAVVIEEGVTSIGRAAFNNCQNMQSISLPSTLESIGDAAFLACIGLPELIVPDSVTHIGEDAFHWLGASTVVLPSGLKTIAPYTFWGTSNLTTLELPKGLEVIGTGAFAGSALTKITIPAGVHTVGDLAFDQCLNLTEISFCGNAPTFGENIFSQDTLTAYYPSNNDTWTEEVMQQYGGTVTWTAYESNIVAEGVCGDNLTWCITTDGVLTISGEGEMSNFGGDVSIPWMPYNDRFTSVVIEEGVTGVGDCAFGFHPITSVSLPDTLTRIGIAAFSYTMNLTGIELPNSLTTMYALGGLTNLESISIPEGVTVLPPYLFTGCSSLKELEIPASVTTIGEQAFYNCTALAELRFRGDAPAIAADALTNAVTTAYYPANNDTWTEEVMQQYGGTITWVPYTKHEVSQGEELTVAPNQEATVKVEAELAEFVQVKINGQVVDPENYTLTEGSTIITFKPEFLVTLGEGTYNVTIEFETGLAFVTITLVDEPQPEHSITYTQASISLAGDIGLNYYATLSDDLMADEGAYRIFTVAGEEQIVPISEAIISTGENGELVYRFSCAVPARMMSEQVVGQMYASDGTAVGEAKAFSVKAYCDKAIAAYGSYASYANLVSLMKAMLNYGGYSQVKFGYNTGNLANADLADTSLPSITGADLAAFAHGKSGSESGITIQSVSLLLESTTTIRFYFKLDGSKPIESYTFIVDGEVVEPVLHTGTTYYVDKVGVPARELDVNSYVEVGGLTVWYSGMSYVRQVLNSSTDTALINACKALYAYSEAANAYFK